jgi:hypothetical protein
MHLLVSYIMTSLDMGSRNTSGSLYSQTLTSSHFLFIIIVKLVNLQILLLGELHNNVEV